MMGFGGKLEIYFHHVIIQFIVKLYLKCHNIYVRNKNMLLLNLLKKSNGVKLVNIYIYLLQFLITSFSQINPHTIKSDSMWVHVDEEKYINDELFSDIRKNFANKVALSTT
jgi:hypothetical protein